MKKFVFALVTVLNVFLWSCSQPSPLPARVDSKKAMNVEFSTEQGVPVLEKPRTLAEKLEIIKAETGYYESYSGYAPMVILKIKNVDEEALSGSIEFKYVFTDTETREELANSFHYFQVSSDIPLPAGGIRQIYFQSDIVYTYPKQSKKITCSIYLDKKLWKTFDIKYKFLTSNRIQ